MALMDMINKLRGQDNEEEEELPDDVTRDKHLRSLRRMRRVQMEEVEKVDLKKQIADFNQERTRKHLFGIKEKVDTLKALKRKKVLSDGKNLLHGKSLLKVEKLQKKNSMLNKGNML